MELVDAEAPRLREPVADPGALLTAYDAVGEAAADVSLGIEDLTDKLKVDVVEGDAPTVSDGVVVVVTLAE